MSTPRDFLCRDRSLGFVALVVSSAAGLTACERAAASSKDPPIAHTSSGAAAALAAPRGSVEEKPSAPSDPPRAQAPVPSSKETAPAADPLSKPAAPAHRLYAKTRFVWIRPLPDYAAEWIGYLWAGDSVALKSETPVVGNGCSKWYAIEPRGYVCADDKRATLDDADPELGIVLRYARDRASPNPHRYAESMGVERYEKLPTGTEQRIREPGLAKHLERVEASRKGPVNPLLDGVDLSDATEPAPIFPSLPLQIQIPKRSLRRDSTIAFFAEYLHEKRTFLLTADFAWVAKDRTKPYTPATFQGVHLGKDEKLPIAFFREHDQPAWRESPPHGFSPAKETFARLSHVGLTGKKAVRWPYTYLETTRDGLWVRATDAVVPTPAPYTPWGARVGAPDEQAARPRGRGTWVEASVYGGWLVAFEDTTPVLATLVAPGRGGVAVPPQDPTKISATPTGRFVVTGKFVTATMDAPDEVTHTDVPWVQNFSGPHALHGAYWHDSWGERVSGGCLNLSPNDARFLFDFSEPKVPDGWYGVRWDPRAENATVVLIHP